MDKKDEKDVLQKIDILIEGMYPPIKSGSKSMWDNKAHAKRIVSLRKELAKKIKESTRPIKDFLELNIFVYIPKNKIDRRIDLDNLITGVCDSLQDAKTKDFDKIFEEPENKDVDPKITFIEDDKQIIKIIAEKRVTTKDKEYYRVILKKADLKD